MNSLGSSKDWGENLEKSFIVDRESAASNNEAMTKRRSEKRGRDEKECEALSQEVTAFAEPPLYSAIFSR